jgi:hypothetical protein
MLLVSAEYTRYTEVPSFHSVTIYYKSYFLWWAHMGSYSMDAVSSFPMENWQPSGMLLRVALLRMDVANESISSQRALVISYC